MNPTATVTAFQREGEVARTEIVFEKLHARPLSPSWIAWPAGARPFAGRWELHRLVECDDRRAAFETDIDPELALVAPRAGELCEFFLTYDEEQLAAMQDRTRSWTPAKFHPSPAFRWESDHGSVVRRAAETETPPPDAERVEGGWDHEHCLVCYATLNEDAEAFTSNGEWLCAKCFDHYVVRDEARGWGDRVGS